MWNMDWIMRRWRTDGRDRQPKWWFLGCESEMVRPRLRTEKSEVRQTVMTWRVWKERWTRRNRGVNMMSEYLFRLRQRWEHSARQAANARHKRSCVVHGQARRSSRECAKNRARVRSPVPCTRLLNAGRRTPPAPAPPSSTARGTSAGCCPSCTGRCCLRSTRRRSRLRGDTPHPRRVSLAIQVRSTKWCEAPHGRADGRCRRHMLGADGRREEKTDGESNAHHSRFSSPRSSYRGR